MTVQVGTSSRLQSSIAILKNIDGIEFWDLLDLPVYVPISTDIRHVVNGGDRLDLLAQAYYSNAKLDWVIAWANELELLPSDLITGMTLYIPSIDYIKSKLFSGTPIT